MILFADEAYQYTRLWSANPLYMSAWYSKEVSLYIFTFLIRCKLF